MPKRTIKNTVARDNNGSDMEIESLKIKFDNLMAILDKFPEFLYVSDTDTYEVLFANHALRSLVNKDLVDKKCYEVFQGKSEPCEFCTNDLILKTRQPHIWDNFNPHLGRHFLNTDQIIKWPDGRDVRFETAIDITDQKKIEKMLNASEEKYKSLFEQSSYGFFILNNKYDVVYLNKIAREIYGVDLKTKLRLSDVICPEEQTKAIANLKRISTKGEIIEPNIYNITRPDGQIRYVEIQTFPIWKDGIIDGYHGTVMDVTIKRESELKLREKSEFLDAVIKNTSEGMFVIDEDFNYVLINPASGRILGHNPEEWIGKRAGTNKHPDDEAKSMEAIRQVYTEGASQCDVRVKSSDGAYYLLLIKYTLMTLNNKDHILGMVTDITEKRKAEEALKVSEEKYRSLFENSPEAIIILGKEGKIIECNKTTAGLMEKQIGEIIGKRIDQLDILDSAQSELYRHMFMAMTEGKEMNNREMELIMKGGRSKWIETIPSMIARAGEFYGIQMIARDITDRKLADIEMRKKLLKFDIEYGTVYLSKESSASHSLEAFKELLMVGNEGLLISRKSRKDFQNDIDYAFNHVKVSETDKENHVKPDYKAIHQLVSNIPRRHVIHIDCMEYLISWIGTKKTLMFVQYLKDLAITKGLVVLLSIDPKAISEKELRLIEKESVEMLPSKSLTKLSQILLDILKYISDKNREDSLPSYSDISEYFEISKPTARNRIQQLNELGTVNEIQRGRMKTLEITEKGKIYLVV